MAGALGNQAYWGWSKQSVKGTPITTPKYKSPFSGGNIAPTRNVEQLQETDTSRDEGVSYVTKVGMEGSAEMYARDSHAHSILDAVLGGTVTSGAVNFTHTATPASALPYMTLWRNVGNLLYERFEDVMFTELNASADTGGPLTFSVGIVGRQVTELAGAEPDVAVVPASGAVYNFNEATVTAHGGATSLISNFDLTYSNNVTDQQTDDVVPYDVVQGLRSCTVGYDMIFENTTAYKAFHYAGGTAQTSAITTTALTFLFSKGANNSISFSIPNAAVEEFPVEPDPGGDPVVVSVRARAQRVTGTPILTTVVKNQIATVGTGA